MRMDRPAHAAETELRSQLNAAPVPPTCVSTVSVASTPVHTSYMVFELAAGTTSTWRRGWTALRHPRRDTGFPVALRLHASRSCPTSN